MKLTKAMREAIVKRLIERTRAPRDAKFRNREHALAVRLIRGRYGDDVFEKCRALPEGWFNSCKQVSFEHAFTERLTLCRVRWVHPYRSSRPIVRELRRLGSVSLNEYAPLPASASNSWTAEYLDPLYDELESFARDLLEHEEEVEQLRLQTIAVLASYATVELLSKDWPEGYNLLPPELLAPTAALGVPAVRIDDLNLKIEKLKAA